MIFNKPFVITRHSMPSKLDTAPKDSKCFVIDKDSKIFETYTQVSSNEDDPRWELTNTYGTHDQSVLSDETN